MDTKKPLSIRKDDFINNVVTNVNESGLPLWTVSLLLQQILDTVNQKANEEHRLEQEYYNKIQSEEGA